MKTIHLLTIVGVVIVAVVIVSFASPSLEPPYTNITIRGLNYTYVINQPIVFSAVIEGYGAGCGETKVSITKDYHPEYHGFNWNVEPSCASSDLISHFQYSIPYDAPGFNTTINEPGEYTVTISYKGLYPPFNEKTLEQKFTVISS